MSGVASEMEERKGKEDSGVERGGGAIRKFHPEKNFLPFSRRGDPGISGSRSRRWREARGGGRLTSARGIPTLLAVTLLLIANEGFQRVRRNERRKNI